MRALRRSSRLAVVHSGKGVAVTSLGGPLPFPGRGPGVRSLAGCVPRRFAAIPKCRLRSASSDHPPFGPFLRPVPRLAPRFGAGIGPSPRRLGTSLARRSRSGSVVLAPAKPQRRLRGAAVPRRSGLCIPVSTTSRFPEGTSIVVDPCKPLILLRFPVSEPSCLQADGVTDRESHKAAKHGSALLKLWISWRTQQHYCAGAQSGAASSNPPNSNPGTTMQLTSAQPWFASAACHQPAGTRACGA